jgi:serine phosphatase RsbU (regulator of sigma subunit)/PAS domain-containing protein
MVGALGPSETGDLMAFVRSRVASPGRLAAVRATNLLDTDPDPAFDRIAALAARSSSPLPWRSSPSSMTDARSGRRMSASIPPTPPHATAMSTTPCVRYVIGLDDTFLVDDVRLDPRTADRSGAEAMGVRAWAGAPLRSGGEVIGAICVADTAPRQWSLDDAEALGRLGAICDDAVAAHVTAAAARRADALLRAIVDRASLGFCLIDDDLRFEMVNEALATLNDLPVTAHTGRLVSDVLTSDAGPIVDAIRSIVDGRHEALEVELVGEMPGRPGRRRALRASYFRVDLGDGARRVAALVSDETERAGSRRRAEILAELTRHLAIADDLESVARSIEELAGDYVGAQTVTVALTDETHHRLEVITSLAPGVPLGTRSIPIGDGPCAEALHTCELVVVESDDERRRRYPGSEGDHLAMGSEASVVVPMCIGSGTAIGLVAFGWPRTITRDELPLRQIDTLVDVIAQAVERIRASSQRRDLIAGLQAIVLATPEPRPGLEVAVRYVPAATSLGFGGDWYDVVAIDDSDRTALIIGDVVGHDAAAAVRMTEARAVMRQLLRLDTPLDELFERAHELAPVATSSALATAVVVVVDPTARTLRAASAGHLPPLLLDRHGEVLRLPLGLGPFLGIDGDREPPVVTTYQPGSTLVCYSDGLVESRRDDIDTDIDALASVLAASHRRSCEDLATDIVARFVDADALADDVALVVARL